MREVVIAGVGLTPFGQFHDKSYVDLGVEAAQEALTDAGLAWPDIQQVFCGAVAPVGPFAGNRVGHELGLTGVPIVNVDNASASGNSALHLAYLAVATEQCDLAMAIGVGQLGRKIIDPAGGDELEARKYAAQAFGNAMTIFALAARRRMHEYGTRPEVFGRIAVKSRAFASLNPRAQMQQEVDLDGVMTARIIADPLTRPMCCPVGDGGGAAIVSTRTIAARASDRPAVRVTSSTMKGEVFQQERAWGAGDLVALTAREAYECSGLGPEDFDLVQLHDATASEELEYYEALGLCRPGEGDELVLSGATALGGRIPVNTDGGLLSRGHPLGPTGLAQVFETVTQLRGQAGRRQVTSARTGLVQMTGAGAVCFVQVLQR